MLSLLKTAWLFIRQNDVPTIWRALMSQEAHPLLQFVKYGLCGVLAAVTHNLIMATLSLTLFPAGKGMVADGVAISEALRGHNLVLNNAFAWPFGTIVAYWLNIRFVFTPGRHSRLVEMVLFWVVSAIGFFPGAYVVQWMAEDLSLPSTVAQLGFVFTSVAVNFLTRKFVIFKV
jgi:putative flippase GtrA